MRLVPNILDTPDAADKACKPNKKSNHNINKLG
jgi:hypothetical protein